MLKPSTIKLLSSYDTTFNNLFSACVGKINLYQNRFISYLGPYDRWDTDVNTGILQLGSRSFPVDYIGTTSQSDPFWYSAEREKVIPPQYTSYIASARSAVQSLGFADLGETKISLTPDITGHKLAIIYTAFAPENTVYYCGSGVSSIYMLIKDLPADLFRPISPVEFTTLVPQILTSFGRLNHQLLVESLLLENEIPYTVNDAALTANFAPNSAITVTFTDKGIVKNISANLTAN